MADLLLRGTPQLSILQGAAVTLQDRAICLAQKSLTTSHIHTENILWYPPPPQGRIRWNYTSWWEKAKSRNLGCGLEGMCLLPREGTCLTLTGPGYSLGMGKYCWVTSACCVPMIPS